MQPGLSGHEAKPRYDRSRGAPAGILLPERRGAVLRLRCDVPRRTSSSLGANMLVCAVHSMCFSELSLDTILSIFAVFSN